MPCQRVGVRYPRRAASIVAMSILRISIMASKARLAAARSGPVEASVRARGVICYDRPHLSLNQPQALSWRPLSTIAFHRRSVSGWALGAIWNENASWRWKDGHLVMPLHGMHGTVDYTVSSKH